tara:strand:+ start:25989 stop:26900 length:912 start_codon:yes stop_codon:yes gene_type:complete
VSTTPALRTQGLELELGKTPILQGVDMQVYQGDLYGLLGRNGAGKTTTLRALLGFLPAYRGQAEVLGTSSRKLHQVPVPIGVALDPPGLDDTLSVRQNLELARIRGGIKEGRTVDEVLKLVGLEQRQHNRGDKLSHGQGRRAAVARALLGNPKILILDEPLSGLDPEGVEQLLHLFKKLAFEEAVTVVLSSHHLREVQEFCNRVGLVEQGKVILEGATADLLARTGDSVELHCEKPQAAQSFLNQDKAVSSVESREDGRLIVHLSKEVHLASFCSRIVQAEVGLDAFTPHRASLMDVFHEAVS